MAILTAPTAPGIVAIWVVAGRAPDGGIACSNFMAHDHEGGAPSAEQAFEAIGHLAGHMIAFGVLQGATREQIEQAWSLMRQKAELRIDAVLAGDSRMTIHKASE